MITKNQTIAIIWASNNKTKYGYKIFKDLLDSGYKTIPINPNKKWKILDQKVYKNIEEYNWKINIAIFVVQPKITEKILINLNKEKIKKVRLQPWAESDKAINICKKKWIQCIHNACIMIERQKK